MRVNLTPEPLLPMLPQGLPLTHVPTAVTPSTMKSSAEVSTMPLSVHNGELYKPIFLIRFPG